MEADDHADGAEAMVGLPAAVGHPTPGGRHHPPLHARTGGQGAAAACRHRERYSRDAAEEGTTVAIPGEDRRGRDRLPSGAVVAAAGHTRTPRPPRVGRRFHAIRHTRPVRRDARLAPAARTAALTGRCGGHIHQLS